jgi:AcrR family transcriptional regulator
MSETVWVDIVKAATEAAAVSGRDVAEISLDEIARRAGISRATLYRRIGSRRALDAAVRAAGVEPGGRPDVRARATAAAADLIEEGGLAALTLEAVAARAECSVPALYSQLGGREGLLTAVFERYSPLPRLEELFADPPATLEAGVRRVYEIAFETVDARRGLLFALLGDAAARPDGPTARFLLGEYVPRALGAVGSWLAGEVAAGRVRPLPPPLLVQLLVAPMGLHVASRPLIPRLTGQEPPDRDDVVAVLTDAYLRAVALPVPGDDAPGAPS